MSLQLSSFDTGCESWKHRYVLTLAGSCTSLLIVLVHVSSLLNPSLQSGRTRNRSTYKRYGAHHWRVCVTFHVVVCFFQRKTDAGGQCFPLDSAGIGALSPTGASWRFFNGGTDSGCLYTQTCFFLNFWWTKIIETGIFSSNKKRLPLMSALFHAESHHTQQPQYVKRKHHPWWRLQ